ncbi:hypothetical protein [Salinicola salarius]|nr:hypothetical protein [Salinicola salarius]
MSQDLMIMLQQTFDETTQLYQDRGFQRRVGFVKKPAMSSPWTAASTT